MAASTDSSTKSKTGTTVVAIHCCSWGKLLLHALSRVAGVCGNWNKVMQPGGYLLMNTNPNAISFLDRFSMAWAL